MTDGIRVVEEGEDGWVNDPRFQRTNARRGIAGKVRSRKARKDAKKREVRGMAQINRCLPQSSGPVPAPGESLARPVLG